jgi:hypothetical protein
VASVSSLPVATSAASAADRMSPAPRKPASMRSYDLAEQLGLRRGQHVAELIADGIGRPVTST